MPRKAFKDGVKIVYRTKITGSFWNKVRHCLKVWFGLDMKITADISPEDLICLEEKKSLVKKE